MLQDTDDQIDLLDWFREIVDSSIHDAIIAKLNHDPVQLLDYSNIDFYPIYTFSKKREKTLKSINLRKRDIDLDYTQITLLEIEATGASCNEFLNYLIFSEAKLVNYSEIM